MSWKLAYPCTILKAANLMLRGVVGLGRDGDTEGASEVVFLAPAGGHLQLTGALRGVRDDSVSQLPSLPPVSPEAKKRGST